MCVEPLGRLKLDLFVRHRRPNVVLRRSSHLKHLIRFQRLVFCLGALALVPVVVRFSQFSHGHPVWIFIRHTDCLSSHHDALSVFDIGGDGRLRLNLDLAEVDDRLIAILKFILVVLSDLVWGEWLIPHVRCNFRTQGGQVRMCKGGLKRAALKDLRAGLLLDNPRMEVRCFKRAYSSHLWLYIAFLLDVDLRQDL